MGEDGIKRIRRQDIFNISFYKKTWFHGSFQGMNYRIEGVTDKKETEQDPDSADKPDKKLRVTTWPGPCNFDHTDDSLKTSALFDFSDEGLDEVTEYLNRFHAEHHFP